MKKQLLLILWAFISLPLFAASPVLVSPTNDSIGTPTMIGLQWQHVSGVSFYDVDLDTTPLFNSSWHRVLTGNTDYSSTNGGSLLNDTIQELHYGTKYYWKVIPRNSQNNSESAVNSFTTNAQPRIFGPSNGSIFPQGGPYPTIYHDLGGHYYKIEIGNTTIFTSPVYISVSADFSLIPHNVHIIFNDISGLMNNLTYYWRVKAYNSQDSSQWSDTMNFVTTHNFTSVEELYTNNAVLYPNPANDQIQFNNLENIAQITIIDIHGSVVQNKLNISAAQKIKINELSNGLYIVKVTQNNTVSTYKLLISR